VCFVVDQRQQLAPRIANLGARDPRSTCCNTVPQSQEVQRGDRIRRENEAESRLAKLGCAFEHDRLDPSAFKRDRRRQSADTRSDDNCSNARSVRPAGGDAIVALRMT
jgi:hypothetical protein